MRLSLVAQGYGVAAVVHDGPLVRLSREAHGDHIGAADDDDGLLVRPSPVALVNDVAVHDCVL